MNEDTFTFRIIDNDDNLWSFVKKNIRSYERVQDSTMPTYGTTLSASEVDDSHRLSLLAAEGELRLMKRFATLVVGARVWDVGPGAG